MAIFLTITLAVSIAGMATLLLLKRYELSTGRVFLANKRPAMGAFFHHKLMWVEHVLPGLVRVGTMRAYRFVRLVAHVWAARAVVTLEHGLERLLQRVQSTTQAPRSLGRGSSAFLREVVEHKKRLQDDMPEGGTVLEE